MTADFYLALTPWLVFVVADRSAGLGPCYSAALAAAVAAVIVGRDMRMGSRHLLPVVGVGLFSALASAAAVVGDPASIDRYDRTFAAAVLMLALLVSAAGKPLTLAYSADGVSQEPLTSPAASRYHARVTLCWSGVTAAVALSFAIATLSVGPITATLFNWLVPMVLVIATAVHSSHAQPVATEEATAALNLLDGFLSNAAGRSPSDAGGRTSLRLVPTPARGGQVDSTHS